MRKIAENLILFLPQYISYNDITSRSFVSIQRKKRDQQLAVSLSVWVGLSIFADMANKRLAWSNQAVPLAGPPSRGSLSSGLRATDHCCSACLLQTRLGVSSLYLLIFWAKARRSAMAVAADVL